MTSNIESDSEAYKIPYQRVLADFESVTERYYQPQFYMKRMNVNGIDINCDQCVLLHSNRVCVITLSPEHHILKQNKKVVNINYQVSSDTNRLENKVSGKWKKGGQKVEPTSILCKVKCSDGSDYDLLSCVNGTIVEVNQKLLRNCDLLTSQPWSDGYIGIILPYRSQPLSKNEELLSTVIYKNFV